MVTSYWLNILSDVRGLGGDRLPCTPRMQPVDRKERDIVPLIVSTILPSRTSLPKARFIAISQIEATIDRTAHLT